MPKACRRSAADQSLASSGPAPCPVCDDVADIWNFDGIEMLKAARMSYGLECTVRHEGRWQYEVADDIVVSCRKCFGITDAWRPPDDRMVFNDDARHCKEANFIPEREPAVCQNP